MAKRIVIRARVPGRILMNRRRRSQSISSDGIVLRRRDAIGFALARHPKRKNIVRFICVFQSVPQNGKEANVRRGEL
jgi:hypothetical protein